MLRSRLSCAPTRGPSAWRAPHPPRLSRLQLRDHSAEASPPTHSHDVAILGGGITGLASAYFLTRQLPNATVTLYEAKDRVGGWLESTRVPVKDGNILFEAGPRTLRPQQNGVLAARLMQELDLTKDAIFTQNTSPAARGRFLYYPDRLVPLPHPSFGLANILWSLLTQPVFKTAISSLVREPFTKPRDPSVKDESIGEFVSRRFSKSLADNIVSALLHGVVAGDIYKLSAKSFFPQQWRAEALHGTLFSGLVSSKTEGIHMTKREADFLQDMKDYTWDPLLKDTLKDNAVFTFKDGLGMLSDRLHSKLFESGRVEFKTGTAVQTVKQSPGNTGIEVTAAGSQEPRQHSHVISALSPDHLNTVAGTNLIGHIPSVNVMTVNLYFRSPDLHEPGFGYLIPRSTPFEQNPERALGVVFDTAYSPSPSDVNMSNWNQMTVEQLQEARRAGQMINVNDFSWYNMPEPPNMQDHVETRGTKLTVMLGGHWWDGWPALPNEQEGVALARSVLERHLGIKEEPEAWQVNLEKDCIPQYTVGHEQRLKDAHNNIWRQYKGRLRVAGNWMSSPGVNDCLRSAYEVVKNISRDATGLEHVGEAPTVRLAPVLPRRKTSDESER
ncbi:Protoporphyrinogen oxidase [Cercospora zeina]